ncbi:MAG: hypothetical protein ABIG68_05550 [Acidobacteriota bacterium]
MPGIDTVTHPTTGQARPQDAGPRTSSPRPLPHGHPVQWVTATALVIIAAALIMRVAEIPEHRAEAQPVLGSGARGVFAFSGQLSKSTFGVYVVDVDAMTLWVYEYLPEKGCLRLAAARTWRYDRYLENLNICGPSPEEIEQLIEKQREYRLQSSEEAAP